MQLGESLLIMWRGRRQKTIKLVAERAAHLTTAKASIGRKPPSAFGTLACLKLRRRLRFARGVMSLSGQRLAFCKRCATFWGLKHNNPRKRNEDKYESHCL